MRINRRTIRVATFVLLFAISGINLHIAGLTVRPWIIQRMLMRCLWIEVYNWMLLENKERAATPAATAAKESALTVL